MMDLHSHGHPPTSSIHLSIAINGNSGINVEAFAVSKVHVHLGGMQLALVDGLIGFTRVVFPPRGLVFFNDVREQKNQSWDTNVFTVYGHIYVSI